MPQETIVVVDDNQDSLAIFGTIFSDAGYRVVTGTDGLQAIELVRVAAPALLVVDIHLPRMDGIDVIRAIRADPASARVPILALTADALPETRTLVERAGCDLFFRKPLDPKGLLLAVRGLIEDRSAGSTDPLLPELGPPAPAPA